MDMMKLRSYSNVKVKCYKDSVYYGQIINANRHGKGIMIYRSKRIYEGEWENEVKHGKGMEISANGNIYKGDFLNGKPDGLGNFFWKNGQEYQGEWRYGLKHGSGMWKGNQGESYVGEWKNDKPDGYGVYVSCDGDKYEGEFVSSLKHGHGTEKFVNGDAFVGYYENSKPNGLGEYRWGNGSYYRGYFKNGLRHGKGIWRKNAGASDTYEGEWINDKKCGVGIYNWSSGNFYKGSYYDDLRHGYGEMYWNDGSYYHGNWRKGLQDGVGELYLPQEPAQKGLFREGVYLGPIEISPENDSDNKLPHIKKNHAVPIHPADLSFLPTSTKAKENHRRDYSLPRGGRDHSLPRGGRDHSLPRGGRQRTTDNNENPRVRRRTYSASLERLHLSDEENIRPEKIESKQVTTRKHRTPIDFNKEKEAKKKLAEKIIHDVEEFSFRDTHVKKKDQATQAGFFPSQRSRRAMVKTEFVFQEPPEKQASSKRTFTVSPPRKISLAPVKPLDAKELVRWNSKREGLSVSDRKRLDDVNNPEAVARIREMINPPTWKWWRMYNVPPGKSDLKLPIQLGSILPQYNAEH